MHTCFGAEETERVVNQYKNLIAKISIHYFNGSHEVEDIIQDVFMRWYKHQPVFESPENEKAWFIRVAVNICKDRMKSSWFRLNSLVDYDIYTDSEKNAHSDDYKEVMDCIYQLPANYRMVVYLHYYEGYQLNEIAKILKRSPNTIQTWHQRAKEKLKVIMGDELYEF